MIPLLISLLSLFKTRRTRIEKLTMKGGENNETKKKNVTPPLAPSVHSDGTQSASPQPVAQSEPRWNKTLSDDDFIRFY